MTCIECGERYNENDSTVTGHCSDCARTLVRAWVALDNIDDEQGRGR